VTALVVAALVALQTQAGFVGVRGADFVIDNKQWAFVGANLEVMHGADNRARAEETIAAAARDGLAVGRIWALGEGAADATEHDRRHTLFRAGPDGWLDGGVEQLDRVVAAARAHGVRLVIVLANQWGDYGGVPMYLRWAGLDERDTDRFWSDARTRTLYRAHVERLLARTNALTNIRYVDDPTILGWELMNESQVRSDDGARARVAWIREMGALVHARAPRQLVSAGVWGYGTRRERALWLEACRLREVDYCDSHLYPEGVDSVADAARLDAIIDDRAQLARFVAKKPLVVGEFGFRTFSEAPPFLGQPRAVWFARLLARVARDGGGGALAWILQPWAGKERDFGIYIDRDDTDDVRAALREAARVVSTAPARVDNPALGPRRGAAPLYDPYVTLEQPSAPAPLVPLDDGGLGARVDATAFRRARFERAGVYRPDGGARPHAYGAGDGRFVYEIAAAAKFPSSRITEIVVRARLSAEVPGTAAPNDARRSRVAVRLAGVLLGTITVAADDGEGRDEVLRVVDPMRIARLAGRLAKPGPHALELVVAPGARQNGLCVYGSTDGRPTIAVELVTSRRR
jgi:mannan endo-1,4-beta-mannosidase